MILRYLVPLLLASATVLLASCSDDDEEASPGDGQTQEPAETIQVEMTIEDFSFDPAVIDADLGDEISIELANDGEQAHTFTISELVVDQTLESGQDIDVTFTPDEPGEFTYYCRIHRDRMQGALRIAGPGEEPPGGDADASPTGSSDGGGFGY